ncbi:hypothetical protein D3C71_2210250 [compost metagenome]
MLRQRFGAADDTPNELLRAFESAADALQNAADRAHGVPADGPIMLGEGDFA